MPEEKDIEDIENILSEMGEEGLDLDKIDEELKRETKGGGIEDQSVDSSRDEGAGLEELLKDIEIGMTEEKELEEKLQASQPPSDQQQEGEGPSEEEGLALPKDFSMEEFEQAEAPPEEMFKSEGGEEPLRDEKGVIDSELLRELGVEEEAKEPPEEPEMPESGAIEESITEEPITKEETEPSQEEEGDSGFEFEYVEKQQAAEEGPEGAEKIGEAGLEAEEGDEAEFELPEIEEEELADIAQKFEEGVEEPSFPEPEAEGEPVFAQGEEARPPEGEEPLKAPAREEPAGLELSEEDIVLIKTKLKQTNPALASTIRDIIVKTSLPFDSMKGLIDLLLTDAPEPEIVRYVEQATGKRISEEMRLPEAVAVRERPRAVAAIAENLGPLVRVTGLFIAVMVVLGMIFMLFFYRPLRSNRFYQEGIEYIRNEQYEKGEQSFAKATRIYEKVSEYDSYGYVYMLSGNYDAALTKFTAGIEKDPDVKDHSIRIHLAKLYNVLGNYSGADKLYDTILEKKPDRYDYVRLKGLNLIDWGKEEPEQFEKAYGLFREAFSENRRNADPLLQMLSIHLLKREDENIDLLYGLVKNQYPKAMDKDVFTELARYYIDTNRVENVRDILMGVVNQFPESPKAAYTFALYYKALGNKQEEEQMLLRTITNEKNRKLEFPWDTRNRDLLSNAYNDLGELYSGKDIPGMQAEAISYFKQAIAENTNNTKAYFNLAQAYFYGEKNYDLARRYYETAQSMGYADNDLKYNLGVLYFYERSFQKALDQWSRLAETMPGNPNIGFAMGNAFLYLKKYNAAIGEFLMLSEFYDELIEGLGEIRPWRAYHRRILVETSAVYNNLGVAYQKLFEMNRNPDYQKQSLVFLYKAGELVDLVGTNRGEIQYNINYIMHPEVIRSDMAINDSINDNYRFVVQ